MTAAARVPPNDLDAERVILSDCLIDPHGLDEVSDMLSAEMFYSGKHQNIWRAMLRLHAAGTPVDIATVGFELKRTERLVDVGGMGYMTELLDATPAVANAVAHATRVVELWRLRQTVATCEAAVSRAYAGGVDAATLLDATETQLMKLSSQGRVVNAEWIGPLVVREIQEVSAASRRGESTTGMRTGIEGYDALTGGLHRGDLAILAARPGMGKTALALGWARSIVSQKTTARGPLASMLFSLEMPRKQVAHRTACMEGGVDVARLRLPQEVTATDWSRLTAAATRLQPVRMRVDDSVGLTVMDARAKVRRLKVECAREGIELAVVIFDYLQLMTSPEHEGHREQEVSFISRSLKALAKELDIAVVALSQLSRATELRSNKRPILSDLRESGAIEQDADVITFVYRPAYYQTDKPDPQDDESAELIIAKQRNGPTATTFVRFEAQYARFSSSGGTYQAGAAAE